MTPTERVFAKVDQSAGLFGCWPWLACTDANGYGRIKWNRVPAMAHRVVYELLVGPVSKGLALDHDCHTRDKSCSANRDCAHRRCVNPVHLVPVTQGENVRRSRWYQRPDHLALRGHHFTPNRQGKCGPCMLERVRLWRASRKVVAA